jgi:hypothetical protein
MRNQHTCFSQLTFGLFFIRIQYESDKLNILHIVIYITIIRMTTNIQSLLPFEISVSMYETQHSKSSNQTFKVKHQLKILI